MYEIKNSTQTIPDIRKVDFRNARKSCGQVPQSKLFSLVVNHLCHPEAGARFVEILKWLDLFKLIVVQVNNRKIQSYVAVGLQKKLRGEVQK